MIRSTEELSQKEFDLVVIGGGIHGAMLFWRACLSGLSTALIENADFGHATSASSQKIIHGGLRYLQSFNIPRIRQSVRERRRLMKLAPHLVRPLPCIMPIYGHGLKGREAMWAGLRAYDMLSLDRNSSLEPSHYIPAGRLLSAEETLHDVPGVLTKGLLGGANWYDSICLNTERLVLEFIKTGCFHGGVAANYVKATGITRKNKEVTGVKARDVFTKKEFSIRARKVAACVGPWINEFYSLLGLMKRVTPVPLAAGVNIIVQKKFPGEAAFAVQSSKQKGRLFVVVPWNGKSIIGTEYFPYKGEPDDCDVTLDECETLLKEFNLCYPTAEIQKSDITFVHKGLLPCTFTGGQEKGEIKIDSEFKIVDFSSYGFQGLTGVTGVKYTTAGFVAEKVLKKIFPGVRMINETAFLQCSKFADDENFPFGTESKAFFKKEEVKGLIQIFGSEYKKVLSLCGNGSCPEPEKRKSRLLRGMARFSVQEEMACTLSDIAFRRIPVASSGFPADGEIDELAGYMQEELNWSEEKKEIELESFFRSFPHFETREKPRRLRQVL
ncbi:MAG: FAD-dependent oxidoreductase [Nitrospinota bacterium]